MTAARWERSGAEEPGGNVLPSARECDSPFFLGVHLANPFTAPALLGGGFIENYEKAI